VADILSPHPSYETAAEAALGEALQYVLVSDQDTGKAAIGYLAAENGGRSGFIPVPDIAAPCGGDTPRPAAGRLVDYLDVTDGYEQVVEQLLGHVVVAENIDEALSVWNRKGVHQAVVTKTGDLITPEGVLVGGSRNNMADILVKKQEIRTLEDELAEIAERLHTAREMQQSLEHDVRDLQNRLHTLTRRKNDATQKELSAQKTLYRFDEDEKSARRHLEVLTLEEEQLLGEEIDIDEEISENNAALQRIQADVTAVQEEVAAAACEIDGILKAYDTEKEAVVDMKLSLTNLQARMENAVSTGQRLSAYRQEGLRRAENLQSDIAARQHQLISARERITACEKELAERYRAMETVAGKLRASEIDYQAIDTQLQENDTIVEELKTAREKTLEKVRMLELEQSQRQIKRENTRQRLEETYHHGFAAFRNEFKDRLKELEQSEGMAEELTAELEKLRTGIARFTDVNLGAIKEYEQLGERYDFITRQRDDLVKAIEDLHRVIRKINRITQSKFMETFKQVNEKLQEVFPRLFEGGSAQLVLTQPNAPLETGVEFMIHPPGKKLTRMSLLSGGEKALSAIAFIFSIFLIKPTSFCLMDEIDAPLDEANVFRFNNLVRLIGEKSQIVMVTHNKKSMEFADMLFGVTMETKGVSKVVSVNLKHSDLPN